MGLSLVLIGVPTAAVTEDGQGKATPVFRDIAEESGLDFVHMSGMIGRLYFPEVLGGGVAVLDYDNDGDLDIYLGQGSMFGDDPIEKLVFPPKYPFPQTDRLYRNDLVVKADGSRSMRFVDVTAESRIQALGYNMGVATGDYDNDGWVDIYVTNLESNHLLRNLGNGTFEDTTEAASADDPTWSVAASFLDYDRDGWLDLFIGNYTEFRQNSHKECTNATGTRAYCGPLSYTHLPNRLLHNRGDGTFENVSGRALPGNPPGSTLGSVIGDFNDDGWIDIYVANDQIENNLWVNQHDGTFLDDAVLSGSAVDGKGQAQASMGALAGDLNGDGHEDIFLTHLRMEMNTLYINDGSGMFEDKSNDSGLGHASFPFTGFGTALVDYDNDGVLDLYVANGAVKGIESQIRAGDKHPVHETNQLFRGVGEGRFEEVEGERREFPVYSEVSRGVAAGDLDNDGDVDLVVSNNAGHVRLLRNEVGSGNPWLGLRLLLAAAPRDAIGAKVELRRRGKPSQFRRVRTDGSYVSANDPRLLFGLGPGEPVLGELRVTWPDGSGERFGPEVLVLGAYTTLRQGQGRPLAGS